MLRILDFSCCHPIIIELPPMGRRPHVGNHCSSGRLEVTQEAGVFQNRTRADIQTSPLLIALYDTFRKKQVHSTLHSQGNSIHYLVFQMPQMFLWLNCLHLIWNTLQESQVLDIYRLQSCKAWVLLAHVSESGSTFQPSIFPFILEIPFVLKNSH